MISLAAFSASSRHPSSRQGLRVIRGIPAAHITASTTLPKSTSKPSLSDTSYRRWKSEDAGHLSAKLAARICCTSGDRGIMPLSRLSYCEIKRGGKRSGAKLLQRPIRKRSCMLGTSNTLHCLELLCRLCQMLSNAMTSAF